MSAESLSRFLEVNPEIQGGVPVFRGTRVPAHSLFDHLEAGDSIEDFLEGFRSMRREQVDRAAGGVEVSPGFERASMQMAKIRQLVRDGRSGCRGCTPMRPAFRQAFPQLRLRRARLPRKQVSCA